MTASYRRITIGLALMLVICIVGVIGYLIAGWNLFDAMYMVVITIFGVGYGEVHDVRTPGLRLFTMALIIAGCSGLIYILGGIFQLITEGELNRMMGKRRMTKEIDSLANHTIICGYGRLGRVLAKELQDANEPFVVLDKNEDRVREAADSGWVVFHGDASDEDTLEQVGICRAKTLATVLPQDAINVFITLTARQVKPDLMIVARAENPTTEKKLIQAGANKVVLPAQIGAVRIAHMITKPSVMEYFERFQLEALRAELSNIGVVIDQVPVTPGCRLVERTVSELENAGDGGIMVVAVHEAGGGLEKNPLRDRRIQEGDRLLVMGHDEDIANMITYYQLTDVETGDGSDGTTPVGAAGASPG